MTVFGLVTAGCAGGPSGVPEGTAAVMNATQGDGTEDPVRMQRPPRSGEEVRETDLTGDKVPDARTFTVLAAGEDGAPAPRLTRKELDLNADGRVDQATDYGAKEQKRREALDLDFDGRVDQVTYFDAQGRITRKERDLGFDARPDVWLYYERGQLVRKERDSNGDGRVDSWESWVEGRVDRVGEDVDGDGEVDRWTGVADRAE